MVINIYSLVKSLIPDQKIIKFLEVLEAYRLKCESEKNYLEAEKAVSQAELLRKQVEFNIKLRRKID